MASNSLMTRVKSDINGLGAKFVVTWQNSASLEAFMASGICGDAKAADASAVAAFLRNACQVPLKKMPRLRGAKSGTDKASIGEALRSALVNAAAATATSEATKTKKK